MRKLVEVTLALLILGVLIVVADLGLRAVLGPTLPLWAVLLLILASITAFGVYLYASTLRHLEEITAVVERISQGDLEADIPHYLLEQDNEIGEVAHSFQRMLTSFKLAKQMTAPELEKENKGLEKVIEEKEQAERDLKKSQKRMQQILEHTSNLFYVHDTDHVITYVSPQVHDFFGLSPEEAKKRWTEFATDNPINEKGMKYTQQAIDTGEKQPPYELELEGEKGKKRVLVNESPVVENGKTVAIVGALTDITDLKKEQEELEKLNKELEGTKKALLSLLENVVEDVDKKTREELRSVLEEHRDDDQTEDEA